MKLFYFTLLTCVITCAGCGSKEIEEVIPDTTPIELDLVHKDQIRLWCRSTFNFEAYKDGEYTIEAQNPEIVKVGVDGKTFIVKTLTPGETVITIKRKTGGEVALKCYSRTFANVWKESRELDQYLNYKNTVMVAAENKSVADVIREELESLSQNRNYEFRFTEGTNELSVLLPAQGAPVKGTYEWDFETATLTLNYKGQTERYTCDIQPEFPNFWIHQPRFIMAVKQDLTRKYASQYPSAGIEDVYIIRYIMALGDWWLTEKELR